MARTRVIFKFWDGQVIAVFPEEPADFSGNVLSYMHIGQHGAASMHLIETLPDATPAQYKPLLEELTSIGYKLKII